MANNAPKDKVNLMGLYLPNDSPTCEIMAQMRKAVREEQVISIPYSQILSAQQEIKEVRQKIDGSTPEFAQDLNKHVFGDSAVRAILVMQGDFLSAGEIKNTILPFDLGTNPWPIYQGRGDYETVDAKVTADAASEYLQSRQQELRAKGISKFNVGQSGFFYLRDEQLKRNFGDSAGGISLEALIPYIVDTYGFVGLEPVSKPNEQDYRERAVPFVSYRQKGADSLLEKVIRKLCQISPIKDEGGAIADWGGHRICAETEQETISWSKILQKPVNLGRFRMSNLHTDDYYSNPKKTGFKSYNATVRVISKGIATDSPRYTDVIREIQLYDLISHFNSQINEKHHAFHRKFREREERSLSKKRAVLEGFEYHFVLGLMFGTELLELPVPK